MLCSAFGCLCAVVRFENDLVVVVFVVSRPKRESVVYTRINSTFAFSIGCYTSTYSRVYASSHRASEWLRISICTRGAHRYEFGLRGANQQVHFIKMPSTVSLWCERTHSKPRMRDADCKVFGNVFFVARTYRTCRWKVKYSIKVAKFSRGLV